MLSKILFGLLLVFWISNMFFHKRQNRRGVQLTKPLLMPLLLIIYLLIAREVQYLILLALFCGFVGDVCLLMVEKRSFFISGLSAFLLGHIFYIVVFLESTHYFTVLPGWVFLLLIPYLAFGVWLYRKLADVVGEMKIPVLLYMTVIILMSFTLLTRGWVTSVAAFMLPFLGSLFFLCSDTLLALHIFKKNIRDANVWIMATYVLAQMLIIAGLV